MRYSCDSKDPGYWAWQDALNRQCDVVVYLDGIEQPHVVTADSTMGFIRQHKCRGRALVVEGGQTVVVTRFGHVWVDVQPRTP